jgi:hypothetical protein
MNLRSVRMIQGLYLMSLNSWMTSISCGRTLLILNPSSALFSHFTLRVSLGNMIQTGGSIPWGSMTQWSRKKAHFPQHDITNLGHIRSLYFNRIRSFQETNVTGRSLSRYIRHIFPFTFVTSHHWLTRKGFSWNEFWFRLTPIEIVGKLLKWTWFSFLIASQLQISNDIDDQ